MQETSFPIEILIHDDASTDGTTQILKEYEQRYPLLIKVFYETVNQFGKATYKGGYRRGLLEPASRGKYIAFTEGDDYWCDSHKLVRQVSYLEKHDDITLSCHASIVEGGSSGEVLGTMGMGSADKELSSSVIIRNWDVPTSSWVYRRGSMARLDDDWTFDLPVGDFPTVLYASMVGRVYYHHEQMSVYRYQVPGSWTSRLKSDSGAYDNARRWLALYENLDRATNGLYRNDFVIAAKPFVWNLMGVSKAVATTPFIREVVDGLSLRDRIKAATRRLLRSLGFDVTVEGYGPSSKRRIVRL